MQSDLWHLYKNPEYLDKIAPWKLPLAPLKDPLDNALVTSLTVTSGAFPTSLAAASAVIVIFVPVSPSGTGNTFSSLIYFIRL